MKDPDDFKNKNLKSRSKLFLLCLLACTVLIIGFTLFFDVIKRRQVIEEYRINSTAQLNYQSNLLLRQFDSIRSDLLFLPQLNEFFGYMEDINEDDRLLIEKEFLEFTRSKLVYDQIRFLDTDGQEIVRINFNKGRPLVVPREDRQNKGTRYYFQETVAIEKEAIYISPFDLNVEQGRIEQPLKPMIRFGTPIYNNNNEAKGIVILNYLGDTILDELKRATRINPGTFSLLNSEGYWLYNDFPDHEWGFMYPDRKGLTFSSRYPELWEPVQDERGSTILADDFLLTSTVVTPFSGSASPSMQKSWILMNTISFDEMGIQWRQIVKENVIPVSVIFAVSILLSLILSHAVSVRNQYQRELKHFALYDSLTNLPNRMNLEDRVGHTIERSKRYSQFYGLLYIDLDGFKAVNDTLGHKGGDELLVQVSQRLKSALRSVDTVARVGGDEFVVLLDYISYGTDLKQIAEKILESLSAEYELIAGKARISASIGYIIGDPSLIESYDALLQRADKAMYEVKQNGKSGIREG